MSSTSEPPGIWIDWLLAVSAGVVVFGLILVLAPSFARHGFSLLVYATPYRIDTFGQEQVSYISLSHAVLGGVMAGWGSALFYITRHLLARGSKLAWNLLALSLGAWFVPDTSYSLLSGYWQNAVLNTVFLLLFGTPLVALRPTLRSSGYN